jgi:ribosomal-protein-alanine N-acetyltransferase
MRWFANAQDRAESDGWGSRIAADLAGRGWGFWVVDLPGEDPGAGMVGVVGIKPAPFEANFTPAIEIGWRIATRFQRRGLAEEAARLSLAFGFGPIGLDRIVAWTPLGNEPSWRLMEKLGMRRDRIFEHPGLPAGHPLRRQFLYGLDRSAWVAARLSG